MADTNTTNQPRRGGKETPMSHHTTITSVSASQAGALDGFEVRCTCGDTHRVAFRLMADQYAAGHVAYMAKKGR